MNFTNLIISSVQRARASANDLIVSFVVRKQIGFSYVNGRKIVDYSNTGVTGIYDKMEFSDADGTLVEMTDHKILLFIDSIDQLPRPGDLLQEDGIDHSVRKSQPVYAGSKPIIAFVFIRK